MTGNLVYEMIKINGNDMRRINHALKVLGLAKCIAERENTDKNTLRIIEAAAVLHDIAIHFCEEKYDSCGGKLQEKEGPAIAEPILRLYSDDEKFIGRVLYIISHHHTYENIDGLDYRIVVEADFLVNAEEGDISKPTLKTAADKYFKTNTAKELARTMFEA